ncbi:histidine phosphatase family protein [Nitrincola tapanii]|uniref:Histidine phosphatase family protein n=1 Tax=Nitrincola tapanii TaxID=1708751 RepID=A0A5A9W561_9GAMM|nr:histidine phosphatase family protein [Nitrincola tapanii]KAA0875887.1 histidine phosphatase family protein [Nitrincola tapanii]
MDKPSPMKHWFLRSLLSLVCLSPVWAFAEQPDFTLIPATPELLESVKQGGYVLFLRHGPTDARQPDQVPVDLNDCATQRPLTEEGRELMVRIGHFIRQFELPHDEIYTSPLCRAVETSQLVFPQHEITLDPNLIYVAALTSEEKIPIVARTQALLSRPSTPGSNRIVVAHGPNLVEVMEYFPVEGTLVIFRPDPENASFTYLGSVEPSLWPVLLKTKD